MEKKLVLLKLVLDELKVGSSIDSMGNRKGIQKAIYLAQLAGLDMGYRFGWYIKGPYSPGLTKDYYELAHEIATGEDEYKGLELTESVKQRVHRIDPLLKQPSDVDLPKEDWLELVASVHYLMKLRGLEKSEALKTITNEKKNLSPYFENGYSALHKAGFLAS